MRIDKEKKTAELGFGELATVCYALSVNIASIETGFGFMSQMPDKERAERMMANGKAMIEMSCDILDALLEAFGQKELESECDALLDERMGVTGGKA